MISTECLNGYGFKNLQDDAIVIGDLVGNDLNGFGPTYIPDVGYQHGKFQGGKMVQGIQLTKSGDVIFSSFTDSNPSGFGYRTYLDKFKVIILLLQMLFKWKAITMTRQFFLLLLQASV